MNREDDDSSAAWAHHESMLEQERQERIEQAIRNCERALQEFWQRQDEPISL